MEYKILSYLLFYPNEEYLANLPSFLREVGELKIDVEIKENVITFVNKLKEQDGYDAMSTYVSYFDNNPSLSLYLFDHIMGESKERGQALIDLKELYKEYNFEINSSQLPDYLPLFLEFLSAIDEPKAKELCLEAFDVINTLYLRHEKINSIYAGIFKSLIIKMGKQVEQKEVSVLSEKEIDELWKEAEVTFANKNNAG